MAKENQKTVGEVDELDEPVSVGAGSLAANEDTAHDSGRERDSGREEVVSAPPSLALWLADELRPSPSKSLPPAAPVSVDHPETLAPVAVPQTELSEEDLAVLPPSARPGRSGSALRSGILVLLGAAAAVFLFSYAWSPTSAPQAHTEPAAQPLPAAAVAPGPVAPPAAAGDVAPFTTETSDETTARRIGHGRWLPPVSDEAAALDAEARLRGPSVGRFPDLPAEYWSELRRRDLESRAERQRQLASGASEP
ncbi:MAG TPA: hypothetical protein VFU02_03955 [Polyangiaceae bacterium]|nr:hypothetical protein [Polyangiaceae bacterium]